ncbi:hypothetical protein ACR780_10120 [Sphingobacterium faecium]|uniref:hypothetical protein n=1 Tax=Sphingobacterium faecium TaxID=34087 RepID=UPI003DA495CC
MEINKEHELIVLSKILDIIRFNIIDDESSYLALSPITTELYMNVQQALFDSIDEFGTIKKHIFYIEDFPHKLEAVTFHLKNVENWDLLIKDIKNEIIDGLVKPYKFRYEETLNKLLNE